MFCLVIFLDTQVSLAPTPASPSVGPSVRNSFGFPFCQCLWDLTKRRDDIVMADMEVDIVAYMVANNKKKEEELADMEFFGPTFSNQSLLGLRIF